MPESRPLRVAYLGPAGTFTEEALRCSAPAGPLEEVACSTIWDTVMAVERGAADRAVVPIENSLEGSVRATLDALAVEASGVRIAAEVVHPITHCLIGRDELALGEVERVVSHPQALAQCARFLRERLGTAELTSATSTAEAVRLIAEAGEPWAAIGSVGSAELYGCRVMSAGIEDEPGNVTRFVWLAPAAAADAIEGAPVKTSLVFWGFNDTSAGSLVAVLGEFAERGVNLSKIESRPGRVGLGSYMFFVDLDGAAGEPAVRAALGGLAARVTTVRMLGSYPVLRSRATAQPTPTAL